MTLDISVPLVGRWDRWRTQARKALSANIPPDDLNWGSVGETHDLFSQRSGRTAPSDPNTRRQDFLVPRSFVESARKAVWHRDVHAFALLYRIVWRLQKESSYSFDRTDEDASRVQRMAKNVSRCQHKMKAFVRFNEADPVSSGRRYFVAWFEPTHFTLEPTSQFFRNRFADMDWSIFTPDLAVHCIDDKPRFESEPDEPCSAQHDRTRELWATYYRNIFNPSRLKVKAMQAEMPKKYWKNMPETELIPELVKTARERQQSMVDADATDEAGHVSRTRAQVKQFKSFWDRAPGALHRQIAQCSACPLSRNATQAVPGEGSLEADLMVVGEQPGDREDLVGRPFVGPAGLVFDNALRAAGLDRSELYVTNAVKHFKFALRGKRRIHQKPSSSEVQHCKGWLDQEIELVQPRLILAMGATAAGALTGNARGLLTRRGTLERTVAGIPVLVTIHPSYILRESNPDDSDRSGVLLVADLISAKEFLSRSHGASSA